MAEAADSTTSSREQSALTLADLNIAVNHEPRVEDVRLAEALGMERPRNIRKLVERHREALERLGEVCSTVEQTSAKGGRPGRTFWLNKRQALYLCTKSETPRATEVTITMVEVFDAYQAGRLAAPAAKATASVPFLPGPEHLVSSLHVAQALRRRHTGILRLLDVLAAERPELLGRHIRFATYLHENGHPYRCFHLDRTGFDALMGRIPHTDRAAEALRDASLRAWPEAEAEAPASRRLRPDRDAPQAGMPDIERDGFAVVRFGGEVLIVDMTRFDLETSERAVRLHPDGTISVGAVDTRAGSRDADLRAALELPARPVRPDASVMRQDYVRVVGAVVASQSAARPRSAALPKQSGSKRLRKPERGCPALANVAVLGHA